MSWRHFRLERLADGVYAAVHADGGWMICNVGLVDLGERTLIYDTGLSPQAAVELRAAAVALTGRVPYYVVNSHYHNDHIRGNQVFDDGLLVSTAKTRGLIATRGPVSVEQDRKQAPEGIAETEALARSEDPLERNEAALFLPYWQAISASLPGLELRLPCLTFGDSLALHGSKRTARLLALAGHTESDCVLFLPEEGVVFCGDLLFVRSHPYLASGDPDAWLSSLDKIVGLGAEVYLPGHGPVGGRRDLDRMELYIRTLMELAREIAAKGKTVDDAAKVPVPESFADWALPSHFEYNLRFLYERVARRA